MSDLEIEVKYRVAHFINKDLAEIKEELNLPLQNNKASYVNLAKKMLGVTSNKIHPNVIMKIIRVNSAEYPAENMSFMPIDFDEWIYNDEWQNSKLYKYFSKTTFVFMIFQEYSPARMEDQSTVFKNVIIWNMDEIDLNNGLKEVWDEVRRLIKENKLIIQKQYTKTGKIYNKNNFPKTSFNYLGHIRPGGVNGKDVLTLPNGQVIAKQRFWFNQEYIDGIIKSERGN